MQKRQTIKTTRTAEQSKEPAWTGFGGQEYAREVTEEMSYDDAFASTAEYLDFLRPRLEAGYRTLQATGSLFFHIDWRMAAHCRILLEEIFGGGEFCKNEIIWSYDFGARSKKKWPAKHDNIYWFTKDPENYIYNFDKIDRVPYMAPDLVGKEKAAKGKTLTDVWWNTIVPTNSKEKTGYPTQKPLKIIERILKVHTNENDLVMDFFAGSGTLGAAALKLRRKFILMDRNPEAITVINKRLKNLAQTRER